MGGFGIDWYIKAGHEWKVKFFSLEMEGCCFFKALFGEACDYGTKERKRDTEIVPLL